jgi:hypothetical protein
VPGMSFNPAHVKLSDARSSAAHPAPTNFDLRSLTNHTCVFDFSRHIQSAPPLLAASST